MIFFPALVTGRLCDMGYFKHTHLFFRSVASLVSAWEVSERLETPSVFLVVVTVLIADARHIGNCSCAKVLLPELAVA